MTVLNGTKTSGEQGGSSRTGTIGEPMGNGQATSAKGKGK